MKSALEPPREIADFLQMTEQNVKQVLGVAPDLTPETLPLLDDYLRQTPVDLRPGVRELLVATVGCYFGEVMRRRLFGRWVFSGEEPTSWRIELEHCFLYFSPVGMAGEVLVGAASDAYDGGFATSSYFTEQLSSLLSGAPPVPEDEYYTLSGRSEILQQVADWLTGLNLASEIPTLHFTEADYRAELARLPS